MEVPSPGGRNCCEGVCTSSRAQQAGAGGRDRDRATPGFQVTGLKQRVGWGTRWGKGAHETWRECWGGEEEPGAGNGAEAESGGPVGPATPGV